jgi:vesicle-fusing ATPase
LNPADLSKQIDEENIKVTKSDFLSALDEVKPAFGAAINTLEMCRYISLLPCFSGNFLSFRMVFFVDYQ